MDSTCQPFETNPQCQVDTKTCTEYDETDPAKCLKWQTTYLCQAEGGFTSTAMRWNPTKNARWLRKNAWR